jgi:hypothetical protein
MHVEFLGVRPRLLAHGHHHVIDETTVELPEATYETKIWSLNCDGVDGNIRYLDLATLDGPASGRLTGGGPRICAASVCTIGGCGRAPWPIVQTVPGRFRAGATSRGARSVADLAPIWHQRP